MPNEFFDKAVFLFVTEDERFEIGKMMEGEVAMCRTYLSQGVDSTLLMKVKKLSRRSS